MPDGPSLRSWPESVAEFDAAMDRFIEELLSIPEHCIGSG